MNFRFTEFGFINALCSLIPIFPIFTLFPGILTAMGIQEFTNNCETSYTIVLWTSIVLTILLITIYTYKIDKISFKSEKHIKYNFRFWNLILYTLVNTLGLILIIGIHLACNGDGQTVLACIMSGPIASLTLIAFGLLIDLKLYLN